MIQLKLTPKGGAATSRIEARSQRSRGRNVVSSFAGAGLRLSGALVLTGALSGCINIAAPEEPIVIELNVNIRAEVLYRLADDANETIEENADIF